MANKKVTVDGNTAAAHVAYAYSDVAAIYPITPSSSMGEMADEWASQGRKNIFGKELKVTEMQSEGGAAGAIHGSLTGGALTTTFTCSQGLLLMLPNMFKIAGELLPCVFHVSSRSLAAQSLSIFGDHSDVMAVRDTGFALLAGANVQEVHDMAIVAHLSSLESNIPFINFFDGFRTSSEIQKVELAEYDVLKELFNLEKLREFRKRGINPETPYAKVGAQNPDVYFQGRETVNKFYDELPGIVKKNMKIIKERFGREYKLFEYYGANDAKKIIVAMGSGCDTLEEAVDFLNKRGEKVGVIKVRLYRPFFAKDFVDIIPSTVKKIAVLDRTKEPGSLGEPLYLDIVASLQNKGIEIIGGRYGLSSKEFTPTMIKEVFDHMDNGAWHGFTVGIHDDVTKKSIPMTESIDSEQKGIVRCKFWGLGSDGTVGANKNSIKIIGDNTDKEVQGYFEYDSKKSGGITISHLRFGDKEIKSQYLLIKSDFVAVHKQAYIGHYDVLEGISEGGTFLLNCNWKKEEAFAKLPCDMQQTMISKKIKYYIIDANAIAQDVGLAGRINTVMQVAFFKITDIIDFEKVIGLIKEAIHHSFDKKGQNIVKMNCDAVDRAVHDIVKIELPSAVVESSCMMHKGIGDDGSSFVKDVMRPISKLKGNTIPVSKMPIDGVVPTSTSRLEKRGVGDYAPEWVPDNCIRCGRCSFVCPHAAIRVKQIDPKNLANAPATFKTVKSFGKNDKNLQYKVQVFPEDCVGCGSCVEVCPAKVKAITMQPIEKIRGNGENINVEFFCSLPDNVTEGLPVGSTQETQVRVPYLEFSGACGGCGETPYVKLVTQLFGDRMIIANATGCSSIWGGTFPTIPYCKNKQGKGPAWANSLFEDNAEYGFGMKLAVESNRAQLYTAVDDVLAKSNGINQELIKCLNYAKDNKDKIDDLAKDNADRIKELLDSAVNSSSGEQKATLEKVKEFMNYFVDKSVWIIGGDGWAYDIGFGGLDHVLAQGKNVNVLVLDTEVYSNTGGQASKSTPLGSVAKFAASGKKIGKKDLGLMAMSYGYIYVASVSMGADMGHLIKVLREAEEYDGPSLVICYSPCIAHGIDMSKTQAEEKKAVDSGYWNLYRYDPRKALKGENPFTLDSKDATLEYKDFLKGETRYKSLEKLKPEEAKRLFDLAEKDAKRRHDTYKHLAENDVKKDCDCK